MPIVLNENLAHPTNIEFVFEVILSVQVVFPAKLRLLG